MNMSFIYGVLATVFLFLCLFMAYQVGYMQGKKIKPTIRDPVSEEEQKARKVMDNFQKVMNYDTMTAYKKKVIR